MSNKYFSYDSNSGFEVHATKEEAIKAVDDTIDTERDYAIDDGWSEEVSGACWGEIKQVATEYNTGHNMIFNGEATEAVDYKLEDI